MKVENPSAFWCNAFTTKVCTSQKGDKFSWRKYTSYAALSATTIRTFIAMAKILTGIRSINAGFVVTSFHPTAQRQEMGKLGGHIHHVQSVAVLGSVDNN
jgi:hypothetical protein